MITSTILQQILLTLTSQHQCCVAFSGGEDSHVLLHAMARLRDQNSNFTVRAIHIHHGLSPHADQWVVHCQKVCDQLNISLMVREIKLTISAGDSVEAIARQARYNIFRELLNPGENLLTAHTLNDQTETFLLQLFRGAGVKGLSAMPAKKKFGLGFLLRPLINFTRDEIEVYAKQHGLRWIEDETNVELRFNRNFLRHQVIPILRQRWPEIFTTIARSAGHCAEATTLLDTLAAIDTVKQDKLLAIEPLRQLSVARQRNVLRYWIRQNGYVVPNTKHLDEIGNCVINADASAIPVFSWNQVDIRRYQNYLYLMPTPGAHDVTIVIPWDLRQPLVLPNDLGVLATRQQKNAGIISTIDIHKVTVRFRQGGERCRPAGRQKTHTLKQLMQDWQIPPWERDRVPLIFCGDDLVSVVGYCVCEDYVAKLAEGTMITRTG